MAMNQKLTDQDVEQLLYALGDHEREEAAWRAFQETPSDEDAETPECPSASEVKKVLLNEAVWTNYGQNHISTCEFCKRFIPSLERWINDPELQDQRGEDRFIPLKY